MSRRNRSVLIFAAFVFLVAVFLLDFGEPPPAERTAETPRQSAQSGGIPQSPQPTPIAPHTNQAEICPQEFRFRIRDIASLGALAHAPFQVTDKHSSSVKSVDSDKTGILTVVAVGPVTLASVGQSLRLVNPAREYPWVDSASESVDAVDVWAYGVVTLHGTVTLECPSATSEAPFLISAGPTDKLPTEWSSDPARVGSPTWVAANLSQHRIVTRTTNDGQFEIEVPALRRVAVAASAPGHYTSVQTVDCTSIPSGKAEVSFFLRQAPRLVVIVKSSKTQACPSARVRMTMVHVGQSNGINVHEEVVLGTAARTAVALDSTAGGTVTRGAFAQEKDVDPDGRCEFQVPVESAELYVVVRSPGFVPHHGKIATPGTNDELVVVLEPLQPLRALYILECDGKPLTGGSIVLAESFEWLTLELPTLQIDSLGQIATEWIVPGRKYFAFLDVGGVPSFGEVVFGDQERIDVSGFRR